ncbi:hypothetical protein ABC977_02845 [Thioalkalicoccus limnaeus]|uniref:PIN domain-containing protein n=1 Tax=Thioalkalicoccus limnaeus TaxID=120681 RepID=A0ABV4BAJ4_9GAMM
MKLLLDTQIMLWWLLGDARLRQETRELMATRPLDDQTPGARRAVGLSPLTRVG